MLLIPDPEVVSLKDAAAMLDVHYETALVMAKAGQFPGAAKRGGRWKVSLPRFRYEVHGIDPHPEASAS